MFNLDTYFRPKSEEHEKEHIVTFFDVPPLYLDHQMAIYWTLDDKNNIITDIHYYQGLGDYKYACFKNNKLVEER